MQTLLRSGFVSLLGGLTAYFAVLILFPEVSPTEFTNIIGFTALAAGIASAGFLKYRAKRDK